MVSDMESLQNKLKSLGVFISAPPNTIPPTSEKNKIEDVLDGEELSTIYGNIFITHHDYPPDYQHGKMSIGCDVNPNILAAYTHLNDSASMSIEKVAFLDTETSGLSGGTGTLVFLIGIGFYTEERFRLTQVFLRTPGEEQAFLSALEQIIAPFELLVTYNGKSFDIPLLNTRYSLNLFPSPFQSLQHMDLLHLARKMWKIRLPSRSLSNLENEIIQFHRTQEEIPGWLIPSIYFDYLQNGNAHPLAGVFYHNSMDILSLTAIFCYLSDLIHNPICRVENNLDFISIAYLNESKGQIDQAISLYIQALARDIPDNNAQWTLHRLANIYKRNGDWQNAIEYWTKAADNDHLESCIELAKYYEHHARNIPQAIQWAEKAYLLHKQSEWKNSFRSSSNPLMYVHRIERLHKKRSNLE
jgi:uncharacterized protein YprB with RNaseH-like and TPR domain